MIKSVHFQKKTHSMNHRQEENDLIAFLVTVTASSELNTEEQSHKMHLTKKE